MSTSRRMAGAWAAATMAALIPSLASGVDASASPAIIERLLRLQIVDQPYGVVSGDEFAVGFNVVGSQDDIERLGAALTPPEPAVTSTTAAPATAPEPDPPAAASASVVITAHDIVVTAEQLTRLDEQGPSWTTDSVELPAADVLAFADGEVNGALSIPIGLEEPLDDPAAGLDLGEPGIYPITIDVRVAGEVVASSLTFIELIDPAAEVSAPLAVSIIAGLDDPGPWPSSTELNGASIEVAKLIELGEAVDGPLSIALPPVVVHALTPNPSDAAEAATETTEVPSTSAPATTVTDGLPSTPGATEPAFEGIDSPDALLEAFRADELLASPDVALDPSSIVAIDQNELFVGELRDGEDILSTASPRAVVSRAVWLSDHSISADAVVMLRNLGIRMVVVSADVANGLGVATDGPLSDVFGVSLGDDGTLPAMTFSSLGSQLQTPLPSESTPTANDRAVRLLVELQLARANTDVPAVLLATPRITVPDPAITARFVALANDMPDISVVPISRLPGIVDGALRRNGTPPVALPPSAGTNLTARLARVTAARDNADEAASMLVESNRDTQWNDQLDRVMSSEVDDPTALLHLGETEADVNAVLGAIVPPDPFTFTITGTQSTLPLTIRNTSVEPLTVRIRVRASKIIAEQPADLVVPAQGSVIFPVPVEARSNGTFTIEVDVLTPDGDRLALPVILKARVTRVTGLSQVVTGGAALVLASWWFSHLRHNRKRRLAAADTAVASATPVDSVSPDAAEAQAPAPDQTGGHVSEVGESEVAHEMQSEHPVEPG